jgi:hypothetical protein
MIYIMTKNHKKAVVTEENMQESARLKKLWEQRKRVHNLNQTDFGEKFGIGTQGAVWMCLNGRMAISFKAGIGFARGLRCDLAEFSPRLANMAGAVAAAALDAMPDQINSEKVGTEQAGPALYAVKSKNVWPFGLFDYAGWMMLSEKDRDYFEFLIAGAVQRAKQTASINAPAAQFTS